MSLSEVLKVTRQKAFMTQEAFANEIHVTSATINRWENGRSKPNLTAMKNLKKFCSKYDVSYEKIEREWFGHSVEE